ncbi:glycosyltransferase family 39 protein [Haloglomus halophilum]|uniref:glycosyltransferase family 39 protein n=1 Tax=Haloglomus halophilum TaxID=2962672 RepID=UPI0020C981C7|nr:glycosyltransferase family 39 protein [Haloglomus halophilum]
MARRLRDPRLLAVFALGAVLRLSQLGHESLWTDELITLEFVTRWSGLELLVNLPTAQPHLPVYYLVLDAWVAVAGTSALALRLPSAVFGIAALPAMYLVVARTVDHEAGIVAALLLAVSRFHVRFSQEVRMYSLLVFLALLSVYLLLRVRETPTRRNLAGFAAVTVLLAYTHVFAVFVVAAEGLYVAYRLLTAEEAALRPWALAFTPVALSLVPFVAAAVLLMGGADFSLSYVPPPTVERALKMVSAYAGYGFGTTWLVHLVVIPAFLGTAVLGLLRYRLVGFDPKAPVASLRDGLDLRVRAATADTSVLLGALFVVPFGLPIVLSYAVTPIFWPRYTIAASLGLFALVARGVRHVDLPLARYGMAGLLVLAMVPSLGIYYTGDQKEQWREVGATIDERAAAGDLVLVADQITERGARHYVDRDDVRIEGVVVEDSGTGKGPTGNATIRAYQRDADGVWLVFSHASEAERDRVRDIVADGRERTFHRQYEGVEVYRYEAADESGGSA